MFLNILTHQQKRIFLGLAKKILTIDDGNIDKLEKECLQGVPSPMERKRTLRINLALVPWH
jgi:hypothetical protein